MKSLNKWCRQKQAIQKCKTNKHLTMKSQEFIISRNTNFLHYHFWLVVTNVCYSSCFICICWQVGFIGVSRQLNHVIKLSVLQLSNPAPFRSVPVQINELSVTLSISYSSSFHGIYAIGMHVSLLHHLMIIYMHQFVDIVPEIFLSTIDYII